MRLDGQIDGLGIDLRTPPGGPSALAAVSHPPSTALPIVDGKGIGGQVDAGMRGGLEHSCIAMIARRELADGEHEREAEAHDQTRRRRAAPR